MNHEYSRRRTLIGISTAVAVLLNTNTVQATEEPLSDADLDEFESEIRSLFAENDPLPVGIEIEDTGDENGGITSRVGSVFDNGEASDEDRNSESPDTSGTTGVDVAHNIDEAFDTVTDIGERAEQVAAVENDFTRQTFRAQHLLGVLSETGLVQSLGPDDIATFRKTTPDVFWFLPLIGSANNVITAAAEVEEESPNTVIDFYVAVAAFCVEVVFFKFAIGYRIAFQGTNVLATQTTFARLLQHTSPKTYALVLSEIHWALREGISKGAGLIASNTLVFAYEITQSLNEGEVEGEINGAPEEINLSRKELSDSLCELGSRHDRSWLDEILGERNEHTDTIVERSETIVEGSCRG